MLSLLCGSPDVVDSPFYSTQSRRPSRGMSISRLGRSRSGSSKTKKRVLKGSIGAPTAFRHEGHVGADNMMAPAGAWDLDQWRAELEKHMQVQPCARSEPVSSSTSPMISPSNSVIAPRRKPVPSLLPAPREERQGSSPSSSAASSPTNPQPIGREQSPGVALV